MRWFPDPLSAGKLSDEGYSMTCAPMARASWYNALTPAGAMIASGPLQRCLDACEKHHAGERLGDRGKRQYRPAQHRARKLALSAAAA